MTTYTETFEAYNGSSYATGSFALATGSWYVVAAYKESEAHGGSVAVRLNDDVAGSSIVSPVMNGIGTISFWYRALNNEASDSTFKVQTSVNGGSTWTDVNSGTFKTQTWAQFSCTVNSSASSIQFRVPNDNQPGHLFIDDLVFTSYGVTGGAASSSSSALSSAASSMTSASSSSSSSSSLGTSSSAGGGTVLTENMSLPQSVRDYYRSAYGLSGSALKSALHTIISTGYTRYGYGWDQYTDIDAPAGVSASANQVVLLYTGVTLTGESYPRWNREHVWAKSHGFPAESQYAHTDFHHLRPADVEVNSTRGNKDFDYGGSAVMDTDDSGLLAGYSDADSFEPLDFAKGDVARMVLYMDVRYDGDGLNDGGTADLRVVNYTGTASSDSGVGRLGKLSSLLEWHILDGVSAQERQRNDRIYANWQRNRNPFIDYPEAVALIWGTASNPIVYDP